MGKLLRGLLALTVVLILFPVNAMATAPDEIAARQAVVIIGENQTFEIWGYHGTDHYGNIPWYSYRLHDIAYILNNTPWQFNIRELQDDRRDYWIVPGEPFVPDGTQLQPVLSDRYALIYSSRFLHGYGFDSDPRRAIVLGIGGDNAPATAVSITVVYDEGDTFFLLCELGELLGFYITRERIWVDGFHIPYLTINPLDKVADLPVQTPEFVDILNRISGHWVDRQYLESADIDESTVWPAELVIIKQGAVHGLTTPWILIGPMHHSSYPRDYFALHKNVLECGLVELLADNARITVDASTLEINEITYYINGMPHTMVRFDWERIVWYGVERRYSAEPYENGGIRLLYLLRHHSLSSQTTELRFYRSTTQGERGTLIYSRSPITPTDRILFEFIDTMAEMGQIYYYSIVDVHRSTNAFGGFIYRENYAFFIWDAYHGLPSNQMRVNVDEVLGELQVVPPMTRGSQGYAAIIFMLSVLMVIAITIRIKLKERKPWVRY